MLKLYADALVDDHQCSFLRTRFFGETCDIGEGFGQGKYAIQTNEMLMKPVTGGEWAKVKAQKAFHNHYRDYIKKLGPDLVVLGWDNDSIGKLTAHVSRELAIPTMGCQEGSWTFSYSFPWKVELKKFILKNIISLYYPPAEYKKFYQNADYAAVWGEFDRRQAIKYGIRENNAFVVGDPRSSGVNRIKAVKTLEKGDTFLYLDLPGMTFPKGTLDYQRLCGFRKELMQIVTENGYWVIYKTHPLTKPEEMAEIRRTIDGNALIVLAEKGLAEDYYSEVAACITFPSTCIYTVLWAALPLVQIVPNFGLVRKFYYDPVADHSAGITIVRPEDILKAFISLADIQWQNAYHKNCGHAAEYIMGPADGMAPQRFKTAVSSIFSRN
ncbi:MAG: hypothetical protein V1913_07140 [Fibrobacterota bacterium]